MRHSSPRRLFPTASVLLKPTAPASTPKLWAAMRPKGPLLAALPGTPLLCGSVTENKSALLTEEEPRNESTSPIRRTFAYSVKYYGVTDGDFGVLTRRHTGREVTPLRLPRERTAEKVAQVTPLRRAAVKIASKCAPFCRSYADIARDEEVARSRPARCTPSRRRQAAWHPTGIDTPEEGGSVFKPPALA